MTKDSPKPIPMNTEELEAQLALTQTKLAEAVNALEHLLALYMHTVYGSYDGKSEQPTPVEQARKIIQEHKP